MGIGKRHMELLLTNAPSASDVESAYLNYKIDEAVQVLDLHTAAELYALCDHYGIERKQPQKAHDPPLNGYRRTKRHHRRHFTEEESVETVEGVTIDYARLANAIVDELIRRSVHAFSLAAQERLDFYNVRKLVRGDGS